jgi:hypothetical protein
MSGVEFLSFASAFNAGMNAHATLPGIPTALVTDNAAKLAAYHAAKSPNAGKIDREDRKEKCGDLSKNIRKIKNACLDPDPLNVVTSEILLDFGLQKKILSAPMCPTPRESFPSRLRLANTCKSS